MFSGRQALFERPADPTASSYSLSGKGLRWLVLFLQDVDVTFWSHLEHVEFISMPRYLASDITSTLRLLYIVACFFSHRRVNGSVTKEYFGNPWLDFLLEVGEGLARIGKTPDGHYQKALLRPAARKSRAAELRPDKRLE